MFGLVNLTLNAKYLECILLTLVLTFILLILWKRRHLYSCSWKLPGPISFPLVGAIQLIFKYDLKDSFYIIVDLVRQYSPIFKVWVGPCLFVISTRPKDAEIILQKNLKKESLYIYTQDFFHLSLVTLPLSTWKNHRKIINPTFNINIINSFIPKIIKHSHLLADSLGKHCVNDEPHDVLPTIWKFSLDISCEVFCEVDPKCIQNSDLFIKSAIRSEEMLAERLANPLLHVPLFWKLSMLKKKMSQLTQNMFDFSNQIINMYCKNCPSTLQKSFLSQLVDLYKNNKFSYSDLIQEVNLMLVASSETNAITISNLLLLMGFYPKIQEKIYEELFSICGNNTDVSLEDLNQMDYLERCIKETLRLLPTVPYVLRTLEKDFSLEGIVLPKDTRVVIVISEMHKRADIWPEPLKFDPDRFLPEEMKKRPRCSFIPFSYGPRNCIGAHYAMLSMKIILSRIFLTYKVKKVADYEKLEDMKQVYHLVSKPVNGFRVVLEKRKID